MNIIVYKDFASADQAARDVYNAECDAKKCPTPENERLVKRHENIRFDAAAGVFVALVPGKVDPRLALAAMQERDPKAEIVEVDKATAEKLQPIFEEPK
jgi:hypothetical protein